MKSLQNYINKQKLKAVRLLSHKYNSCGRAFCIFNKPNNRINS